MSMAAIGAPLLKTALEIFLPIVHDVLGGGNTADKVVRRIRLKALDIDGELIAARSRALQAELEGSWLQRNWRPIAMFVFLFLLVWMVVVVPIINSIWPDLIAPDAQLVYKIIEVIQWGMTGYVVGRSAEKTAQIIAGKKTTVTEANDGQRPPKAPPGATMVEPPFMRSADRAQD